MITAFPLYQPPHHVKEQKTELVFNERDIKNGLLEIDPKVFQYYESERYRSKFEDTYKIAIGLKIEKLHRAWQDETLFTSSVAEKVTNSNFIKIVELGEEAIPLILEDINFNPSNLVWALNAITGRRISDENISVAEACKRWVKWGKTMKLIA